MFSIVIPLYNKAKYIARTIGSVLNQTYPCFEILIVDDGSTDNSLDVVNALTDERIRIIAQRNAGVSSARNNGVKNSKYEYITFLDADDWWDIHFLEEMSRLIQKYPDAGLYGSNYNLIQRGKETCRISIPDFEDGYIDYFNVFLKNRESPVCTSAVCIRKQKFLQVHGFKINLKSGEDIDLWIRIAINHRVAYTNKYLAFYNQDVDVANRAITKLFPKENFYIFNIDDIENSAQDNDTLKDLLDFLRLKTLKLYHAQNLHKKEIKTILSKVHKSNYPIKLRLFYSFPPRIVKMIYKFYKQIKKLCRVGDVFI